LRPIPPPAATRGVRPATRPTGATASVDTRNADALAQLQTITGGAIAGALDFVGMPVTVNLGIAALAKGGHFVMSGLFGGEITMSLPLT
jgi:threonine dehydrogenase-like Zn-dependent dehydrogenase